MRLLLDTQSFIWTQWETHKLGKTIAKIIDPANQVFVSSISLAEIAIKMSIGKLRVAPDYAEDISATGFADLPFTPQHARSLAELPLHHRDPFDRMIISQAIADDLTIVSSDSKFGVYDCKLIPVG